MTPKIGKFTDLHQVRRLLLRCLVLGLLVGSFFAAAAPARANVTGQFNVAQRLYNQGQIAKAVRILRENTRKYPGHQPSQLLLGRIYYRAGRIQQAYQRFKYVSTDLIPPDAGYEYGITMFTYNNCTKALSGFSKVPANAREYNLANFYRGVCHMRARRWQKADYFLGRAKQLPANLESSRRKLESFVRQQMRVERQGQASAASPYFIVPQPPPAPVNSQGATGASAAAAVADVDANESKKKEKPPSPFTRAITPSFTVLQKSTTSDNFGSNNTQSDKFVNTLKVSFKGRYDFAPRPTGGQPYVSLGLDGGQESVSVRSNTVKNLSSADDPTVLIEQETVTSSSATNALLVLNPEAGFPVTANLDLTAGYQVKETYPDMKADLKTGTHAMYGSAALEIGNVNLKASVRMEDTLGMNTETKQGGQVLKKTNTFAGEATKKFDNGVTMGASAEHKTNVPAGPPALVGCDPDTMRECTILSFGGDLGKNWESFTLALSVDQVTYTPPSGQLKPREDSSLKFEASGTQNFDFGGSLILTGSMTQLDNYKLILSEDDTTQQPDAAGKYPQKTSVISGPGTTQRFAIAFKLAPVDWIYASLSYAYSKNAYQITKGTERLRTFQDKTVETATESNLEVGVSKTF